MKNSIKILHTTKSFNKSQIKQNKNLHVAHNKSMSKENEQNFNIHVMPPQISDNDITALFNGIINVVKKKVELEKKAEILNTNIALEKVLKQLKEKQSECIRLKNEIIYLKEKLQNN